VIELAPTASRAVLSRAAARAAALPLAITEPVRVRAARVSDIQAIADLNNEYAAEQTMLTRTPESIEAALDDYVVAVDARGVLLACGALRGYSPSLAEVSAIAVRRDAHGRGLGRAVVEAVEGLAQVRGIEEVFALTLTPGFFEAVGYEVVDRSRYPEKIRRDCLGCARRSACREICVRKQVRVPTGAGWRTFAAA
jgi:N-acetylglutamate synthase-like GNAT family acetyltransferase